MSPVFPVLQVDSLLLSHQGGPRILKWVAIPSPGDFADPGIEPALQVDSLPAELPGKPATEMRGHHFPNHSFKLN